MKKRFRINKPYEYKKHFIIKEKPILEKLFNAFSKALVRLKKKKVEVKGYKRNPFANDTLILIGIILSIFVVFPVIYLVYLVSSVHPVSSAQAMHINVSPISSFLVDYGNLIDKNKVIVSFFNLNGSSEVISYLLNRPLLRRAYFVNGYVYESALQNYDLFKAYFLSYLEKMGFDVSEINVENINKIPDGSLLVVANGYAPINFWRYINGKDFYIIYIGLDPRNALSPNGDILNSYFSSLYKKDVQEVADIMPQNLSITETPRFKIKDAYFSKKGYSLVKEQGKPVLLAVPFSLDAWQDGKKAADDILNIFNDMHWIDYSNFSVVKLNKTGEVSLISQELHNNAVLFVFNSTNKYYYPIAFFDYYRAILYSERGPFLATFNVTKTSETFSLKIKNKKGISSQEDVELNVFDKYLNIIDLKNINDIKPNAERRFNYYNDKLNKGIALFEAKSEENKDVLARMLLIFGDLIIKSSYDHKKPFVYFKFFAENNPIRINEVTLKFKGDTYSFSNVKTINFNIAKYFNGPLPVGKHKFELIIGDRIYNVVINRPPQTGIITLISNPINIFLLSLSVIIYAAGVLFKPKEEVKFYIDIPDFPEVEVSTIPITTKQMLDIIKEINDFYKWNYVPVTADEIRKMWATKEYKGKPIYVTSYNIQFILNKMERMGLIKSYNGHYGIASWEKASGFSIKQLSMYRTIRDICVEYAIPFSIISRKKGYHVKLKIGHLYYYGFLYDNKEIRYIFNNSLKHLDKGIVFVLFVNDYDKLVFEDYMASNIANANEFRFAVNTGSIILLTIEEFKNKIKEIV